MAYSSKLTVPLGQVLAAVADRYGVSAEVIDTRYGYLSTTLTLRADFGTYVLKVYRIDEADPHQLAFSASAGRQLRALGIPIPAQVHAGDGSVSVRVAGNVMLLSRFCEGETFEPGNREQLRSAGGVLGRLHRAGERVSVEDAGSWSCMWGSVVDGLRRSWHAMGGEAPAGHIDHLRSHLDGLLRRVPEGALWEIPKSVIHADYRAQNLLFHKHRVLAVLDLDSARPAARLHDLAYAAAFFQAVVAEGTLSSDERRAFVRAYDEEAVLTDGERDLLPAFLKLSLLRGLTLWLQIAHVDRSNVAAADWFVAYVGLLDEDDARVMG